jgi:hypothetical protein
MTRESWLLSAVELFAPLFQKHKLELPPNIRVSCGFPSKGGLSATRRVVGECWDPEATWDASTHIFVSPVLHLPGDVLASLVYQLVQSVVARKEKAQFKAALKEIGLEGPATLATPGLELLKFIDQIAPGLGDYPNAAIRPTYKPTSEKERKKSTFTLFCAEKRGCTKKCLLTDKQVAEDYKVKASRKALALGMPHCPCGSEMQLEEEDFKVFHTPEVEVSK